MTKVGPKEAQRRALRDLQWAPGTPYKAGDTVIRAGKSYVVSATIPKPARRASQKAASEPKGVKGVTEQPNRLGRRPTLTKADHDMVVAAQWQELAVALRWYRAQLAGARKRRIKA